MATGRNRWGIAVVALSFVAMPAFAQAVSWTPFESKEFQFSASFCSSPSKNAPATEKHGDTTTTSTMFIASTDDYMCIIAASVYSLKPDTEQELKAAPGSFASSIRGSIGTPSRIDFANRGEKLPGVLFTFEMAPDYIGKAAIILKGSRQYTLLFAYRKGKNYSAELQKFLESFEITN